MSCSSNRVDLRKSMDLLSGFTHPKGWISKSSPPKFWIKINDLVWKHQNCIEHCRTPFGCYFMLLCYTQLWLSYMKSSRKISQVRSPIKVSKVNSSRKGPQVKVSDVNGSRRRFSNKSFTCKKSSKRSQVGLHR